jgi:DNA-binding XRE family transcriptional regulator
MIRLSEPEKIGAVLRDMRAMLGLTQREMADLLGTRQGRYSEHETGAVVPSIPVLISYFKHLDFDLALVPSAPAAAEDPAG